MHIGMLWHCGNDPTPNATLKTKIERAVDYYRRKYHQEPNLCLVHPAMLEGETLKKVGEMKVRALSYVLPGHLWIGMEDAKA